MSWESRPILVAEDSDDDYFLLSRAFKKAAVTNPIRRAINGNEVINYLSAMSPYSDRTAYPWPYLLLLDLKLPMKHGFEVLEWMRQRGETKALAVVVFSSSLQNEDIQKSYELGANGYISKATSVDDLVEVVNSLKAYWLKTNRAPMRIQI